MMLRAKLATKQVNKFLGYLSHVIFQNAEAHGQPHAVIIDHKVLSLYTFMCCVS